MYNTGILESGVGVPLFWRNLLLASFEYPEHGGSMLLWSASICHTTWYSIPEECSRNIHCYKNLKSSILFYTYSPTTHI
jgi:hypothetical protein